MQTPNFASITRFRFFRFSLMALIATSLAVTPMLTIGSSTPASASSHQVMLGIWQPPSPGDFRPLDNLQQSLGVDVDIIPWYQAWDSSTNSAFRADKVREVHNRGAIPMITWEPWNTSKGVNQPQYSLKQISGGAHDSYIRGWARSAAQINGTIYLRFAHEMNGNWYPWAAGVNGNNAGDYVNAWNHVVDIFRAEGADNVQWVWSPNKDYPGATDLRSLFPGDSRVDWLAIDGYNFGTAKAGQQWRSFNDTFKGTYDIITSFSERPVMIGETGSTEVGGDKAAWIRDGMSPANLAQHFPRLHAIIYFNQVGSGNWPLETSAAAKNAFADTVKTWNSDQIADNGASTQQAPGNDEQEEDGGTISISDLVNGVIGSIPRP